jgi:hypothetical protein
MAKKDKTKTAAKKARKASSKLYKSSKSLISHRATPATLTLKSKGGKLVDLEDIENDTMAQLEKVIGPSLESNPDGLQFGEIEAGLTRLIQESLQAAWTLGIAEVTDSLAMSLDDVLSQVQIA